MSDGVFQTGGLAAELGLGAMGWEEAMSDLSSEQFVQPVGRFTPTKPPLFRWEPNPKPWDPGAKVIRSNDPAIMISREDFSLGRGSDPATQLVHLMIGGRRYSVFAYFEDEKDSSGAIIKRAYVGKEYCNKVYANVSVREITKGDNYSEEK